VSATRRPAGTEKEGEKNIGGPDRAVRKEKIRGKGKEGETGRNPWEVKENMGERKNKNTGSRNLKN